MELKGWEKLKKENVEIYKQYLNSCKSSNYETWGTTYSTYISNFKLFLIWFQENYKNRYLLSKDTLMEMPQIMEEYRNHCRSLGNSKRTLMNKTTSVSSFYLWCVRRNKCRFHPFDKKLDRLKFAEKDKIRKNYFLNTEQILTVRLFMKFQSKKYDIQDRILWELFLDSACRISAVQNLKLEQLRLEEGYFEGVKEKEGYIVNAFFFEKCKILLKEWIKIREESGIHSEWLFITKYGDEYRKMSQGTIRNRVKKNGLNSRYSRLIPALFKKNINKSYK